MKIRASIILFCAAFLLLSCAPPQSPVGKKGNFQMTRFDNGVACIEYDYAGQIKLDCNWDSWDGTLNMSSVQYSTGE